MIFLIMLSFIISIATGYFFTVSLLPDRQVASFSYALLKICLSIGVGLGITSCLFFLWLITFNPDTVALIIFDSFLLIASIILFKYMIRFNTNSLFIKTTPPDAYLKPSWMISVVTALFLIFLGGSVIIFLIKSINTPHGYFDAIVGWNMRARFLFRGGELWETVFSIFTTYPLLIPGTIARIWYYIGSDTTIVPIIVAFLFTFSTVGLLYSSVSILRGRSQGVLAGLLLLSTVIFLQSGMNQVGDVPVGFFYLATIVLFYLNDNISTGKKGFMLILAGITTGLASWTKAEGNLLMVSIVVASTLIFLPKKGFKKYIKDLLIWGIGLIPILAVVIYFKTQITSPSYITDQGWTGIIDKLADPTRYLIITQIMVEKLVAFGDGVLFLLALYLILMGKKYIIRDDIITFSIIVLCFMLIGYFSIYLITPVELSFHVQVSFKRLFLQLWPTIIFVSFMIVKPPIIINDCSVAENMDKLVSVKNQC